MAVWQAGRPYRVRFLRHRSQVPKLHERVDLGDSPVVHI